VEPLKNGKIAELSLEEDVEKKERVEKLSVIVYNKIKNLDFPNIDRYTKDIDGIKQFEDDLLEGKI
jgi:hypothetical protein